MGAFAYVAPATVREAVRTLSEAAESGTRTQVMAGGTDLLVQLRGVDRSPRTIVDIKNIRETSELKIGDRSVFIGAALPSARLNETPELVSLFPGLLEAADLIGSTQIQGRASIGGNLCNASPAGDTIPALIANDAVCVIATPAGKRELPVAEFVVGVGRNALKPGEFLLGLRLRTPTQGSADAYLRFIPRTEMDIAVAGCGVSLTVTKSGICKKARVAIGAVATTAIEVPDAAAALIGSKLDAESLAAAGKACSDAARPISDKRGTADYRRKVVGVLCRRAAAIAHERALARW